MKSGLEKIILKFHDGLQSGCCPVQKNLPRKAELAWQVSRYLWRPPWNFKIFFSRPLFIIILSQKWCQISVRIFCVLPGTKNLPWGLEYCYLAKQKKSNNEWPLVLPFWIRMYLCVLSLYLTVCDKAGGTRLTMRTNLPKTFELLIFSIYLLNFSLVF